jgi:hypothetical protein
MCIKPLNPTQITLLGMLDGEGKISAPSRLEQFVVFMTRVEKVHGGLYIYIYIYYSIEGGV